MHFFRKLLGMKSLFSIKKKPLEYIRSGIKRKLLSKRGETKGNVNKDDTQCTCTCSSPVIGAITQHCNKIL